MGEAKGKLHIPFVPSDFENRQVGDPQDRKLESQNESPRNVRMAF